MWLLLQGQPQLKLKQGHRGPAWPSLPETGGSRDSASSFSLPPSSSSSSSPPFFIVPELAVCQGRLVQNGARLWPGGVHVFLQLVTGSF